jgi:hypothetical protein
VKPFSKQTYLIGKQSINNFSINQQFKKMKKLIIASLAVLFFLSSCDDGFGLFGNSNRIEGKGDVIKQDRDAKDFKGINLSTSANVFVKQGTAYKVTVESQKNILDLVETVVENGILNIQFKTGSWNLRFDKLNVYIETPSVSSLEISGSGDMTVESAFNSDDFSIDISGAGNIKIPNGVTAKKLKVSIGGSGDINMNATTATELTADLNGSGSLDIIGTGEKADLKVTGSGDINAKGFTTKATEADATGSGSISCHASEKLDAHVTGSGDIKYSGNPPSVESSATGSGEIKKQ